MHLRSPLQFRPRSRRAFTLVEVCAAGVVLAIAISGMVGSLVTATTLQRVNTESALAQQAARRVIEEVQGVAFDEVFAAYNGWNGDDAGLTGGVRVRDFAVTGLDAQSDDADGFCGQVLFPTVTVAGAPQLREDVVDANLGMPRDMNGDAVDGLDHSADYTLLPVRIRIEWRGVSGDRRMDFETILCDR
jgi:type II secretory pathway pseudopilin PulG